MESNSLHDLESEQVGGQPNYGCWHPTMPVEVLTIEEFAQKMKVCETTVWKWIRNGKLRPGRHFIQIDRVIRFHWSVRLIDRLQDDCFGIATASEQQPQEEISNGNKKNRYGKRINFDI